MRGPNLGLRTFLLIILSIILLVVDRQTTALRTARDTLTTFVSPLQYTVSAPINFIGWITNGVRTYKSLLEENTSLKAQQLLLNARLQTLISLESENKQLRALLQASSRVGNDQLKVAQVLAVDVDPFLQQIIIDQGSEDGIFVGQPVLDATGVMGQVVNVSSHLARVMLLSDSRSAIPVEISRNGERGIIVGKGYYGTLALINMPATTDIKTGDQLVSSGLDLRYPIGYPVGTVTAVSQLSGQAFLTIEVKPSAHLNQSRLVMLIQEQRRTLQVAAENELEQMRQDDRQIEKQRSR